MLYPGKVIRGGAQMKKVCVISIFILIVGMLFAQTDISNITLMPVKNVFDNIPFKPFGTRTTNVQILNLTVPESNSYVFIIEGWWFIGISDVKTKYTEIKIQGPGFFVKKTLPLVKSTFYLSLEPQLLILPKTAEKIEVLGIEVEIFDVVKVKLPFKTVKLSVQNIREPGIFPAHFLENELSLTNEIKKDEDVYLVVSAGEMPTGGYSLKIESVERYENKVVVTATLKAPPKGAFTTQVLTYPTQIIKLSGIAPGYYKMILRLKTIKDGDVTLQSFETELKYH
jgi:hypothetical protein